MDARPNVKPNEKVWLVKSAGQILGPYSWLELADAISVRQISLIDEVKDPWSRWGFVREHAELKDLVNKVRADDLSRKEDTSTAGEDGKEITITQEITPIPDFKDETRPAISKKFADGKDQKLRQKIRQSQQSWRIIIWAVAAVTFVFAMIWFSNQKPGGPKTLSAEDYLRLARHHRTLGVYTKSLSFYRKAEAIRPLDFSHRVQMIPLLLVVDNQVIEARRWIDEITRQGPVDPKIKPELDNLRGLSYLHEGNYQSAEEEFKKALATDSQYGPAISNLLSTHVLQKKYAEVIQEVDDLDKGGAGNQMTELMRAMSLLMSDGSAQNNKIQSTIEKIRTNIQASSHFKAESLLLLSALYRAVENFDQEQRTVLALLDEAPDRMQDMIVDLQIDSRVLRWDHLKRVCDWIISSAKDKPENQALDAYCLMAMDESLQAMQVLEHLRQQQPTDPRWINLQAYFYKMMGSTAEAAGLAKNFTDRDYKLMNLTRGSVCLAEKDLRCAEMAYQAILRKDQAEALAYYGLSQIYLERNQKELAKEYVIKGLGYSANFRPLVELKEELSGL